MVPLADAAFNVGRAAVLIAALTTGHWDGLPQILDDRLHESVRGAQIPGWPKIRTLARECGAFGATISGSGPSIFIMAPDDESAAAAGRAVVELWSEGIRSELHLTTVNQRGAIVV
jgi:homoserine kinase